MVFKKKQVFSTFFPARISIHKYFLSETIHAQKDGSRGAHFKKILISNFLKSLTSSALTLQHLSLYLYIYGHKLQVGHNNEPPLAHSPVERFSTQSAANGYFLKTVSFQNVMVH